MTRLEPATYLALDGVDVARSAVDGVPTVLLALDGVSITWGRTEPLDQQEAATGSLELFDPSRRWHRSRDWMGVRVDLRWEVTVAGVKTALTFFRGRISRVNPRLATVGGVRGSLVALEVSSVVTDLANVVPGDKWAQEPFLDRRNRISNAIVAAGISGGMAVITDHDTATARTIAVDAQVSLAEHVSLTYDSLALRMSYSPQDNRFASVSRDYRTRQTLGRLTSDPVGAASDRAGLGVYARARTLDGAAGLYLDAADVDYPEDAGVVRDQASSITRIRVRSWVLNTSVSPATEDNVTDERILAGVNELVNGIRVFDIESGIAHFWAPDLLDRYEFVVRSQVNGWQLEPLNLRTSATGGLEELAQLTSLMSGAESAALVFLQSSELPLLGVPPVIGVMGGTLTHTAGHWELTWIASPITLTNRQHALSWEELDDGTPANQVQAWDTPHPLGLHDSLTFEDLAWVGLGHGVPDTGTFIDRGWDYLA